MANAGPRRFAPLKGGADAGHLPKLKGVVFDVDGTLCKPQNHMFREMREVLGISKQTDILDHIYSLHPERQEEALESIRAIERRNMVDQQAQPGLKTLMSYLDFHRLPKGICTRNFNTPVSHLLTKYLPSHHFHPIITRDFRPPKPDPAGILYIAHTWGLQRPTRDLSPSRTTELRQLVQNEEKSNRAVQAGALKVDVEGKGMGLEDTVGDARGLIMVGDSIDDMTAGRRAGAATVLLVNEANAHLAEHEHTDLVIERLDELVDVLDRGFAGREKA